MTRPFFFKMSVVNVVNKIAGVKGWEYSSRGAKAERRHGYCFRSCQDYEGHTYFCTIKADNPVDAANRLERVELTIQQFSVLDAPN